jgi:hypothetical protein
MREFALLGRPYAAGSERSPVTAPATHKEELMRARTLPALVGALILILAAPAGAVDVETIAKGLDNPRPGLWG